MLMKNTKKKIIFVIQFIIIIQILILSNLPLSENTLNSDSNFSSNKENFQVNSPIASVEYPWVTNGEFDTIDDWYYEIEGDTTDHNANINGGLANYDVIGETKTFSFISYPIDDTLNPIWNMTKNPDIPYYPGDFDGASVEMVGIVNGSGMWAYHETGSGDRNLASVNFYHDVEMPVDMTGYEIVSVDAQITYNASCYPTKIETEADDPTSFMYYDHIKFYIDVSDLNNNSINRLAQNRTTVWGDTEDNFETFYPNHTTVENEEDFQIYALTQALATDGYHFRTRVGFDINCEPSGGTANDQDIWDSIYINKVNLTFQYRKKIDQFNTVSWKQDGAKLPTNILINNATLNFKCNISSDWPTSSPNSEFRILINDIQHSETFKLSKFDSTLSQISLNGINVKPLISENTHVNLSIQVYIADDFLQDYNITIWIDDVTLDIDYDMLEIPISTDWQILLNGQDKTSDPQIDLPLGSILNITVKYTNDSGDFIPGAIIELERLGYTDSFDQDDIFHQYNLSLNVDEQLLRGLNLLDLSAKKPSYSDISDTLGVTIRKINTTISSLTGSNIIHLPPESDAYLQIQLDNEDTGETIKNVTVSYSSSIGSGVLSDYDDDGIYTGTISNVPENNYTVKITAIGSDIYDFQPFFMEINASSDLLIPTQWNILFNDIDYTFNPELPFGTSLNITVKYTNTSGDFIPNSTVQLIRAGYTNLNLTEYLELEQYSLILDVDNVLVEGLNEIDLIAEKIGYINQNENLEFTYRPRNTLISSNSGSDLLNIYPEGNATLQVIVMDLDFEDSIKNLTVTYSNSELGSGILDDFDDDGIYEVEFVNIPEGSYPIEINVLSHENYTFEPYNFIINSISILLAESSFQIILNGNNITDDPSVELPIGTILNLTIKFMDESGGFISGAIVKMEKLGYIDYLIEDPDLQQYYIIFKIDDILARGINILNLHIKKIGYQVQTTDARITLRQISTQISSESGSNRIDIEPGETVSVQIRLENLDYDENIRNVTVTYNWIFGAGTLSDTNNDGIYDVAFDDIPEGVYTIEIVVYANDSFIFDTFEFTVAVQRPQNEVLIERLILFVSSTGVFGLMTYVTVYQTKLKYPEEVRKIRKLRRSIKKGKSANSSIDVPKRHEILAEKLKEDLEILGLRKYDVEKSNIALFMTEQDLNTVKAKQFEEEQLKQEEIRKVNEKVEQDRLKKEQDAKQRAEKERLKKEQAEKAKLEKEKAAKEKAEQDRLKKEQDAKQRAEKDRLKREQAEKAKLEKEKAAKEKAEQDRLKKEQAAKQKAEKERIKGEQAEKAKLEKEKAAKDKVE